MSVRYALLGLLAQQPRHGYDLRASFEALIGGEGNWDVKPAQVYTTLARLEESGLVAEDSVSKDAGPEKRVYAITPAGQEELRVWLNTGITGDHTRDEFFIKLMLSLAESDRRARAVIQVQRVALYRELHRVTEIRQGSDPATGLAYILLLDKTIMHLEADLRWLDMVEARLDEMKQQPMPQPEPKPRGRPPKRGPLALGEDLRIHLGRSNGSSRTNK
jgi:DNA-binding PadR family transcriptional regulator